MVTVVHGVYPCSRQLASVRTARTSRPIDGSGSSGGGAAGWAGAAGVATLCGGGLCAKLASATRTTAERVSAVSRWRREARVEVDQRSLSSRSEHRWEKEHNGCHRSVTSDNDCQDVSNAMSTAPPQARRTKSAQFPSGRELPHDYPWPAMACAPHAVLFLSGAAHRLLAPSFRRSSGIAAQARTVGGDICDGVDDQHQAASRSISTITWREHGGISSAKSHRRLHRLIAGTSYSADGCVM